jgi:nucleotide-binding universal stress UspA family protein
MQLLVAVDGSDEAEEAITYAAGVADAMDASMTLAHAVEPAAYDTGGSEPISSLSDADRRLVVESLEDAETRGIDLLAESAEFAGDPGHEVETELLYGDPVEELTDFAEENGFDAIFVGHRGRSERAGLMLGSVAKALVERATVPVTVVR